MSAETPITFTERLLHILVHDDEERARWHNERLKSIQRARELEAENAKLREELGL